MVPPVAGVALLAYLGARAVPYVARFLAGALSSSAVRASLADVVPAVSWYLRKSFIGLAGPTASFRFSVLLARTSSFLARVFSLKGDNVLRLLVLWNVLTDPVWIARAFGWLPEDKRAKMERRLMNIRDGLKVLQNLEVDISIEKRGLPADEETIALAQISIIEAELAEAETFLVAESAGLQSAGVYDALSLSLSQLEEGLSLVCIELGLLVPVKIEDAITYARVMYVEDGDTLTLDNDQKIRLLGIDTPESITVAGVNAGTFLRELVLDKYVVVRSDPADYFDQWGERRLGVVYLVDTTNKDALMQSANIVDDKDLFQYDVNAMMLRNGYAIASKLPPNAVTNRKMYIAAEETGKTTYITVPLLALKNVYYDAKDELKASRQGKYDELSTWKREETDKLRSDFAQDKEDLTDDYNEKKAAWNDAYKDARAALSAQKKAKEITSQEYADAAKLLRDEYYKGKSEIIAVYRAATRELKDPFSAEKNKIAATYAASRKEITAYYAKLTSDLRADYQDNQELIKTRAELPELPEVPPISTIIAPPAEPPAVEAPPVVTPPPAVIPPPPVVTPPAAITWEDVKTKTTKEILDSYPQFKSQLAARELSRHVELVLEYLERHPQEIWNQYYDAYTDTLWIKPYATHDAKYDKATGTTTITNIEPYPEGFTHWRFKNDRNTGDFGTKVVPALSADGTYVEYTYYTNKNRWQVATGRVETVS